MHVTHINESGMFAESGWYRGEFTSSLNRGEVFLRDGDEVPVIKVVRVIQNYQFLSRPLKHAGT